jgi:hypothetical protein
MALRSGLVIGEQASEVWSFGLKVKDIRQPDLIRTPPSTHQMSLSINTITIPGYAARRKQNHRTGRAAKCPTCARCAPVPLTTPSRPPIVRRPPLLLVQLPPTLGCRPLSRHLPL